MTQWLNNLGSWPPCSPHKVLQHGPALTIGSLWGQWVQPIRRRGWTMPISGEQKKKTPTLALKSGACTRTTKIATAFTLAIKNWARHIYCYSSLLHGQSRINPLLQDRCRKSSDFFKASLSEICGNFSLQNCCPMVPQVSESKESSRNFTINSNSFSYS